MQNTLRGNIRSARKIMVEPLFRKNFVSAPQIDEVVVLDGDEGKHATSVRRMRVSEVIQLSDGHGLRVRAEVTSVGQKSLAARIFDVVREPRPTLEITLVQALAKGDRDELAIQAATELGAASIIPWQAERSISRWDETKATKGQLRWQAICDEAAKQSLRSWHPSVAAAVNSKDLIAAFASFDKVLVLDPTSGIGISKLGLIDGRVALIVGPEGGIDESELLSFEASGAIRVHLGDSILRTSTAGIVAISALQYAAGFFD